jgi:uncharacterized protein (TIGR00661 family)
VKILYGIQGTGNGHITRSTRIIEALKSHDVSIDVIISGCKTDKVFDKSVIGPVRFYKGFTFAICKGRIHLLHTIKNLSPFRFLKDSASFDASTYDLVITDFEPVSAMIAGKNGIPSIGLGHQYAFSYPIPMGRYSFVPRLILKRFAPADYCIGMHWHHFNQPILPPVITGSVKPASKINPHLILVYLPFEHPDDIRALLEPFPEYTFSIYGSVNADIRGRDRNMIWHPFSKTTFYDDLASCSGVICNAGFELPSEALSLGKKILVKPLQGQFEQESNAIALKKLNLGEVLDQMDPEKLINWLAHGASAKKGFPDVAQHLSRWIVDGDWANTKQLINNTWNMRHA